MKRRQGELPDKENLPERDKETASLGGLGQFFPRAIDIQANFPGSEDYGQARDRGGQIFPRVISGGG